MRHNKLALYVHCVWSTWDRQPLIVPEIERSLHREMENEAKRKKCTVLAINGVEDHVHLVLEIPPTCAIAEIIKQIKGASSLFVNETLRPPVHFKWQGGYSAFTISRWDLDKVIGYVRNQKEHHASGTVKRVLEYGWDDD
jgi:REP element-mobilizing transposase RayT